jgi:hypothetical protein
VEGGEGALGGARQFEITWGGVKMGHAQQQQPQCPTRRP